MDIKAKIQELLDKFSKDEALKKEFLSDPVKVVEKVIGKDLPDDTVKGIVDGVKAKLDLDSAKGVLGKLKNLL